MENKPTAEHIAEAKRRYSHKGIERPTDIAVGILAEALASPAWVPPAADDTEARRQALKDAFYAGFNAARNEDADEAWIESRTRRDFDETVRAGRAAERAGEAP